MELSDLFPFSRSCSNITDESLKYISAGLKSHKTLQTLHMHFVKWTNRWKVLFFIILDVKNSVMKESWIFQPLWAIFSIFKILLSLRYKIFKLFNKTIESCSPMTDKSLEHIGVQFVNLPNLQTLSIGFQ